MQLSLVWLITPQSKTIVNNKTMFILNSLFWSFVKVHHVDSRPDGVRYDVGAVRSSDTQALSQQKGNWILQAGLMPE